MGRLGIIAGICAAGILAAQTVYGARPAQAALLRPPGSTGEQHFASTCIKCGRCIEACPYQALHAAPLDEGRAASTPYLEARTQACRLCEDFPCAAACPTGALAMPESRAAVTMGTAVINEETCLSYKGMRCEVCYRVCPLIDEAITIDYREREGDAIHAVFAPIVNEDACVGCGLCVQRCPVDDPGPAITVAPLE